MPLSTNKKVWTTLLLIASVVSVMFLLMFYFSDLFIVVLVGLCIIIIIDKLVHAFNSLTKSLSEQVRKVLMFFIFAFCFLFCLSYVSYIIDSISYLLMNIVYFEQLIQSGTKAIESLIDSFYLTQNVSDSIKTYVSGLILSLSQTMIKTLGAIVSRIAFLTFYAILTYPLMFYVFFKKRSCINNFLERMVPEEIHDTFFSAYSAILIEINNYFNAKVIETVAMSVMSAVGFFLIGMDNWFLLGVFLGLLNNIPYIGPWIGSAPAFVIAMAMSPETAFFAVIVSFIVQFVDGAYLVPFMVSDKVRVNSFLSVVLIMAFAQVFGALGMILALPIYCVFRIILQESYKQLALFYPCPEEERDAQRSEETKEKIIKDPKILEFIRRVLHTHA